MPCYSVKLMSVELHAKNFELLGEAITNLGGQAMVSGNQLNGSLNGYSLTVTDGKITIAERGMRLVDEIKQAYSREIVKKAASKYGWAVKQTTQNKLTATRR